jgi:hypothetical protein
MIDARILSWAAAVASDLLFVSSFFKKKMMTNNMLSTLYKRKKIMAKECEIDLRLHFFFKSQITSYMFLRLFFNSNVFYLFFIFEYKKKYLDYIKITLI